MSAKKTTTMEEKQRRKNPHAVALGRLGGSATKGVTSEAKARASAENGKKGGRPPLPANKRQRRK